MSMDFASGKELYELCRETGLSISEVMLGREMELGSVSEQSVRERLARSLQIMEASVHEPLGQPRRSLSGLIGGEAWKVYNAGLADPVSEPNVSGSGAKPWRGEPEGTGSSEKPWTGVPEASCSGAKPWRGEPEGTGNGAKPWTGVPEASCSGAKPWRGEPEGTGNGAKPWTDETKAHGSGAKPWTDEAWRTGRAAGSRGIASLCGEALTRAIAYSMAVLEVNAAMGLIVAAPTAGSSGVLPGAVLSLSEIHGWSEAKQMDGLLNAGAIGYLLMRNATVAGAEAGCQAEVGAASAMTASAIVELMDGTPEMCFQAASLAISNLLGMVCDPIAGLVEVPCQSRNAIGVANAFTCAQLALSGITHPVPFDEMVDAMYRVGRSLPWELRESARGGNAGTPTGCKLASGGCAANCAGGCAAGSSAG